MLPSVWYFFTFFVRLPQELLPVSGPLTRWCASTLVPPSKILRLDSNAYSKSLNNTNLKSCFLKLMLFVNFWIWWCSNILNLLNISMMINKSIIQCSLVDITTSSQNIVVWNIFCIKKALFYVNKEHLCELYKTKPTEKHIRKKLINKPRQPNFTTKCFSL